MAHTPVRSQARSAGVLFRMSKEQREHLQREADEQGFSSVQQLLEYRVFGQIMTRRRDRTSDPRQETLLDIA